MSYIPKTDTTYYNNPLVQTIDSYFNVNPAYDEPFLAMTLGTSGTGLDFTGMGLTQDWIQYSAIVAKSGTWISDRLKFAHGASTDFPALRRAKMFGWGIQLSHDEYLDSSGNSSGAGKRIRAKVEAEIQAQRSKMIQDMCRWCVGTTTTFASETDYDTSWLPLLARKAATGTASDPQSLESTPGTADAYAINMTGTNKSKDFVLNTFGVSKKIFVDNRDSTTGEAMLHNGSNSFLAWCHPNAIDDLSQLHPYNGVQDDQNITIKQQIEALGITLMPTYYVDASYGNAEDGTIDFVMTANFEENFKLGVTVPYTTTEWYTQVIDGIMWHFKNAYQKVVPVIRPYYIGSTWEKAMHHFTAVYKNDAG